MVTGGKIGTIIGRRKAFAIGCVIYGCGSFVTGASPTLPVMIVGWSFLEGVGAALILPGDRRPRAPANFPPVERPRAYGLVAAAGAVAVAAGPLIGGLATTYASWRYVFFGEVALVIVILLLSGKIADAPSEGHHHLDLVSTLLSVVGLGTAVYGVLRSSEWGWITPKPGGPELLGISPTFWLIAFGMFVVLAVLRVAAPADPPRQGAADRPGPAGGAPARRRADHVLLPVPAAGRRVLHRPAVPVGGAGADGDRDRAADHAAVDRTARRRRRRAQGVARRRRRDGSSASACC